MIDLKTSDKNDRFRKNFLGTLHLHNPPDVPLKQKYIKNGLKGKKHIKT